ncbi:MULTISPECIES: serine/threonine-protein kinase [Okeania]|uniref:Serine/threonine protein kinase n=2 Tax=Okeania TaxID=1458928 RepID=A0A3N6NXV7_9CYAN|nr:MULTISPECIES: serine/threonine-protein kinase [Okeania]NET13278.1 protein kinase [Okeania sp. SIO1H6]NES77111.1 protein kinase [Okeania sp. SIO1H4]NET21428.1 protein kinase [Okeania sp. SIO1H5]NET77256.1 protein kinase [Okeania sp. SIO1F9]NET93908.1 protein kinase [Okeania sp. SIO1H2]
MNPRINSHSQNPEDPDKKIVIKNETIGGISNCPPILKERYQVIKPLGESVWSHTFLAIDQDKPSKPPCIIKEFVSLDDRKDLVFQGQEVIPTFSCNPVQLDKIGKHPQIPELLASVEHDGHRYLVQEYIEGRDLATELIEDGVFSEHKIWQILNQLLPVLEFIHDHHLIHGDIKPENIICRTKPGTNTQEFVLVDFGVTISATGDLLSIGSINGSAEYAAPEQTKGKVYPNSDIYSLGVTCLYLLTMVSPFELFDIKADKWAWRDYLKHPISRHLGRILDKMVQRDHRQRYQSVAEVIKDIKYGPTPVDVILQKPRWTVTAWGAAAIALLSLVISSRLPSPQTQPLSSSTNIPKLEPRSPQLKVDDFDSSISTLPPISPSTGIIDRLSPLQTLATTSGPVWSIAASPNGRIIASGSTNGNIQLLHLRSGKKLGKLSGHDGPVWSVAVSPDGRTLVSSSSDSTIKIWNIYSGTLKNTLYGHLKDVFSVAISPDGNTIASVSKDKTIKLWDLNSGLLLYTLYGHLDEVQSVAFSTDGQTLASGSNDGTVKLWDWRYGRLLRTLRGHDGPVWSVAISPDGKTLASGSWDNTIKLWDLDSNRPRRVVRRSQRTLMGHSEKVQSLEFSPDGKTLASGDFGGTIKLWKIDTGGLVGTLKGHSAWVNLTFDPRGKTLISGSFDDTIKVWRFSPYRF